MATYFQININYRSRQRQLLNAVLAIITGVLTLSYPGFLYLIAGGYLMALGLLMIYFRFPPVIAALPIITGILIFTFPNLIPYTFAAFLGFFGLILLMALQFSIMGFLTLIIAVLIVMNPDSVALFIAIFLLLYGVSNIIKIVQSRNNKQYLSG